MKSSGKICFFKVISLFIGLISLLMANKPQWQKWSISLNPIGTFKTGIFADGAAEIVAHDPESQRLFVTNGSAASIDVLDISDPSDIILLFSIDLTPYGKKANSVAVYSEVIAAAVENVNTQQPGQVVFFDTDGNYLKQVTVGALPDMITFSPNGNYVLVANEGEPNSDYTIDPEGSVSIIEMENDYEVHTADFKKFNNATLDPSIRIFGPNATIAQDLEPEFIAVSENSRTAWVTLQENNAIAIIDIKDAEVKELIGLGFKNHNLPGNGIDASNKDGVINIANWPVYGIYQPDAIAVYRPLFREYLVTANEGDSREYEGTPGYVGETRVKDITLDPTAFPNAAFLQQEENLGRLKVTITNGDSDNDGDFDELYSYGARSFSILDRRGNLVFDSGDDFEQITAALLPEGFNSSDEENNSFDDRSDDKGPEPEGVAIGRIMLRHFAFIGLERIGGIMVYEITNPYRPSFVEYVNTRDFSGDPEFGTAGDLAPEGLLYIDQWKSPINKPLLIAAYEVSGSVTIFEINKTWYMAKQIGEIKDDGDHVIKFEQAKKFALHQNYPNPFNPETKIRFDLPVASNVTLKIYNTVGQEIFSLVNGYYESGFHSATWYGQNKFGNPVPSGIYFYKLTTDNYVQLRKMSLIR